MQTRSADVVIIGAGVAGLSAARALADSGCLRVIVVEMERSYGLGSTSRALGVLKRVLSTETLSRMADESARDLPTLADPCGADLLCEAPGMLTLASSPQELAKLVSDRDASARAGVSSCLLGPDEVAGRWPFIDPRGLRAGLFSPDDPGVDPHVLSTGLFRAAREGGVEFTFNTRVTGFLRDGRGGIDGVVTTSGDIRAAAVVNAAGPWAAGLCTEAGLARRPPLDPRRRQIWQVAPGLSIPHDIPLVIDADARFYIRPLRDLFLLSLMEEDEIPLLDNEPPFDWEQIFLIEDRASPRIPLLAQASVARGWAGWRTLTPDDAPVLGRVEAVPGLFMAAGFGGHGLALAPSSGRMVAGEILGDVTCSALLSPFRIERFV